MSKSLLRRTYKFRCYPTKAQEKLLERQLAFACDLYNAALEQRRMLWRGYGVSISHKHQSKQLTALRQAWADEHSDWLPDGMSRSAMQKTLERVDEAFNAFFGRLKRGDKPGLPRFRSRHRFDTLRAQYDRGCKFVPPTRNRRKTTLAWAGVGELKVKAHRELPEGSRISEVQIKREGRDTEVNSDTFASVWKRERHRHLEADAHVPLLLYRRDDPRAARLPPPRAQTGTSAAGAFALQEGFKAEDEEACRALTRSCSRRSRPPRPRTQGRALTR